MRRLLLASLSCSFLALPLFGCASLPTYRDLTPEPPPALAASAASPAADALIARFYGNGAVPANEIAAALAAAPGHAGLHEIAGYAAVMRADAHEAFGHFLAAAADRNALAPELYLWEMRHHAHTMTDHVRAQALLQRLADEHPKPLVRQLAAYELARELRLVGEREEAQQRIATLGFVDAWSVVGSFDNDQNKGFSAPYAPEQATDRAGSFPGMRRAVSFRPLAARKLDGALPLGDAMYPSEAAVAYAETYVHADRAMTVDLRLTTTNGVRVWHDRKLAASDEKIFREELDNVIVRLALAAGENRILVKSAHQGGAWRLAARFTDPRTGAVVPLRAAPTGTMRGDGSGQQLSPMGPIERVDDKNRRRFLLARAWTREGHTQRASHYLDPLRKDAPKNPLVAYYSAVALREAGEVGKALDRLNEGIAKLGGAPAFVVERGRFYSQRRLWDKAQRDLEAALGVSPGARDAAFEIAHVLAARGWTTDRCIRLQSIVTKWPDDVRGLHDLGGCREDQQYYEEAERLYRRAHALAPGYLPALDRLVWLTERRLDHGASLALQEEREAADPTSLAAVLDEAELHRRASRVGPFVKALERARDLSPDAPGAYERLAYIALEANRRDEAARLFAQALDRDPESASLAQRLAALSPGSAPVDDRLVVSADEIDRAIRAGDKIEPHPGSHYVVLLDDEVTTVHPDGSSKRVITVVSRVANTEGRDALIQARLPTRGKVTVREAYSVRKDGERQEASSITGGLVRFRGLDVGSTTVISYVHYAPPSRFLPNEFVADWRFSRVNAEVAAARWTLVMPKDRPLKVELRGTIQQKRENAGAQTIWSFTARNAPPLVPEPSMASPADALWTATVSTVQDWDAFARWEMALLADAFGPSAELDALAKDLTKDARTPREKIDRLWAYVAHEIRYQIEYEDSIAGVKPHSAGMVRERGYGDCKDKAVLLMRLARVVGVEMRFALLRTRPFGKIIQAIPNQQFNHAIVYVPKQTGVDEPFFIDTTTNGLDVGNMRPDDEGALSLVTDQTTGKWEFIPIPYQAPELEYVKHRFELDLKDPRKVTAKGRYETRGAPAANLRVALRSKEGGKKYFQGVTDKLFPGAVVISGKADHDQDLMKPPTARLDVDLAAAVHDEDGAHRLDLPLPFPFVGTASLAERVHPLVLWRGTQSVEIEAELSEGHTALLPADFSVEHPCFKIDRKSELKGRRVIVRSTFRNACPEVAPADYPAFRAAVQKAASHAKDKLVFGPRGKVKR